MTTSPHQRLLCSVTAAALCATLVACSGGQTDLDVAGPATAGPQATGSPGSGTTVGSETKLSQTYAIFNTTSVPLTIRAHSIDGQWDGLEPVDGTVIAPGLTFSFGIVKWFGGNNAARLDLQIGTTNAHVVMKATPNSNDDGTTGVDGSYITQDDAGSFATSIGGPWESVLTVTSAKPTVHTMSSDQGQAQYDALKNLCADGNMATCSFEVISEQSTLADPKLVGPVVENPSKTESAVEHYAWSSTTKITSEWGVEAGLSVGLEGIVKAEVKAHYGQSYSSSVSVSGGVDLTIGPGETGWMTYAAPVERVTGNFTIKLGNDTWHLEQVHYDLPKSDGAGGTMGGKIETPTLPNGDPGIPSGALVKRRTVGS